jgi:ATP-dependent RNA helicase RhlE
MVPGFEPDPDFHEAGSRAHRGRRPAAAPAAEDCAPAPRAGARERTTEARREPHAGSRSAPRRPRSTIAADGFDFSKPYEPVTPPAAAIITADTLPTASAAAKPDPLRRHPRPIAVLLGGLGRK